jgi:hypothetical protein
MASQSGTLETLALELGKALKPLADVLGPGVFSRLGLDLPRQISGDANIATKLTDAKNKVAELDAGIANLASAITNDDPVAIVSAGVSLITTIAGLISKLEDVGQAVHSAAGSLPPTEKAKVQQFAGTMAVRLIEHMSVGYLDEKMPTLTNTLTILGIADKEFKPSDLIEVSKAPTIVPRRLYLDRVTKLFSHPDQHFQDAFQWGANSFDGTLLLPRAQALIESLGVPAAIYHPTGQPPKLEAFFFSAQADNSVSPHGLKLEVSLPGNTTFDQTVNFSDFWKGTVHVQASFAAGVDATVRPPFTVHATPPSGNVTLNALLGLKAQNTNGDPIVLLSFTGGSRLQAKSIGGSIGVDAHLSSGGGDISPALQFAIEEGALIIDFSEGDGFIQQILSGVHLEAGFTLKGTWTAKDGLRLQGSGGVEVFIPVHLDLAIISVNGLYFSIGFAPTGPQIGLKAQFTTNLGPISWSIRWERIS